jgi:hypothetical protein
MAQELADKIRAAAQAKNIDPDIALAIAKAESSLRPTAQAGTSSAGGLFQVVDKTWKEFGGKPGKKMDADENIRVGTDIIAKNTQALKSFLNRDPRPAEIYAAHYFGPTGAKTFLAADPATPIVDILGKAAVKANPNLQGKTAGQVLTQLETKMGQPPKQPDVSRETSAPPARQPLPPSLPPMAGGSMKEQVAGLGAGYQAALALSFLSDTDEKEDRDIDREPGIAEKWLAEQPAAPSVMAQFADVSIKSPFAQPQQPQRLADGGEVKESLSDRVLKAAVPMDLRILGSTLMGNREPITESNFNKEELAAMQQAVDKAAARTGKTQKGSVQYVDYPRGEEIGPGFQPVGQTLGRFVYEKSPTGQTVITDKYDFYNEGRKANVEKYEKMGRAEKALSVSGNMLKNLVTGNLRQIPAEVAEAYIGRDGREVRIQLPVKRADGGSAEPTPEEIAAASRPATVNPNIQRQGEAARRLAAMRDVNTLPDPRTYAAVSGFLGQAPDEQGFSVMHPDAEGIKKAGQAGFGVGTALQVAPLVGGAMKAAQIGPSSGGRATAASQLGAVKVPGKPTEPIFTPLPSAEAPFVGRLDEMVANLQGPVQKDQFLGMLKGKMRDYDIARAESTLADLPGNAKLNPVDLLNRIKTQYDPSQFKTTVIPPGQKGQFYQSMDNPYHGATGDGETLGVIHLSQGMLPDAVAQQERLKEAGLALSRIGTSGPVSAADPKIADDLLNFLQNPGVPLSDATAAKMAEVAQGFRKVAEFDQAWDAAKSNIMYPALNSDFWPTVNNYAKQLSTDQGKGFYDPDVQSLATGMAVRDYSQKGNQWLVANGAAPIDLPDFTAIKDAALHVSGNPDLLQAIRTGFDDARAANREALKEVKKEATEARRMFGDDTRDLAKYEGQHPSLKNPPSPIAFSRFSEHTTEIPGIGKADGIYVNELQSDLLDDLRKRGPKGGSRQKDEEEFRRVLSDINAVADPRSAEAMGLHGRRRILDQRRASPESQYALPEAFAGMETSPQVAQQLMVKNAVSGAMQMGKQFVAFPGAESAQAQLYEKLGPNLKSVVKDLGPGFELRDVTLRDPDGKQLMHKAIVWGPDAAARVQKKGVPFKDGGAVKRQTADHRKYL